jgi:hypothetical protein
VSLDEALELVRPGDALVLAAFVDPALQSSLETARRTLGDRLGVPTTLGIGPRFLHSTGQLHKGGPDRIVVVQVLDVPEVGGPEDLAVPGQDYTFGRLLTAQADGDAAALTASGHRVARVALSGLLG